MSRIEDLDLIAYVDGELDAAGRARVEAAAADDPGLAARLEAHARLARLAGGAFAEILQEPPPASLAARISAHRSGEPGSRPGVMRWAMLAATLMMGVFAGRMLVPQSIVVGESAPTELARALDRGLAAQPGSVRIGLSFRSAQGYCRTFESRRAELTGLACRSGDGWRVLVAAASGSNPTYRTAAAASPAVLAVVDEMMVGAPLDAAGEEAARRRGWR